jgi:tetratricopeptide (TPR) repeat protein
MQERKTPAGALRILLVGFKDAVAEHTIAELLARGVHARVVVDPTEAIWVARSGAAEVVCLQLPLAGADPAGLCATLKEGPAPPAVLLVDLYGEAASILNALPEELRPDGVIDAPLDAARLRVALGPMLGSSLAGVESRSAAGPAVAELLIELKDRRETGVLEVRAEGVRTDVHVHRGDPVLAEGGTIRETLGRLLLRRGALRDEDYVRVIQRMTESLVEHEPLRMGEALVELGLLSPVEVYQALVTQVQDKVVACFQWEHTDLEFRPVEEMAPQMTAFRCAPAEALVLRGVRSHYDLARVDQILELERSRYPALKEDVASLAERWHLSRAEQRFLRGATGERTLDDLLQHLDLDALHASQVLAALLIGRAFVLHEKPLSPATRLRAHTPLGSAAQAPRTETPPARTAAPAQPAASRAAIPVPPTKPVISTPPASAPAAASAGHEAARPAPGIGAADALRQLRNKLERGKKPNAAVRSQKQADLTAEQSFQRGRQLLRQGMPAAALKELERALALRGDELEYQLYEAWAQSLAAGDGTLRTLARARVRQIALRLTRQSKGHPKAHTILGQLLLEEGETEAAEKHFRTAVQSDPTELDATRGLRLVAMRKGS